MPQSERSQIIKEILKWLEAKSKRKGATMQEIIDHTQLEISEMGATTKTIKGYVRSLSRNGLIQNKGLRFTITPKGENWLQRKFLR